MQATFQPSNSRISVRHGRCGPAHDPYGYEVVTIERNGHHWEVTLCGLRGYSIEDEHGDEVYNDFDGIGLEEKVQELTGFALSEWQDALLKLDMRRWFKYGDFEEHDLGYYE